MLTFSITNGPLHLDLSTFANLSQEYPSIVTIDLTNTSIYGEIPYEWSLLENLTNIFLSQNSITSIDAIQYMSKLEYFVADYNQITDFPELPNSLNTFIVNNNNITTCYDFNNRDLQMLYINNNRMNCPLPQLSNTTLVDLQLNDNSFYGTIPDGWSNLDNLLYLQIQNNQINGSLPYIPNLLQLIAFNNSLSGWIQLSRSLHVIDLHTNKYAIELSNEIFHKLNDLEQLVLHSNFFYGSIPSFANNVKLKALDLHNNQFTSNSLNVYNLYEADFSQNKISYFYLPDRDPADHISMLNLTQNPLLCPLPDQVSLLTISNGCDVDWSELMSGNYIMGGILLVFGLFLYFLFTNTRSKFFQNRYTVMIFLIHVGIQLADYTNDIIFYDRLLSTNLSTVNKCDFVNKPEFFQLDSMWITFFDGNSSFPSNVVDYSDYYNMVTNDWPNQQYPLFVKRNNDIFVEKCLRDSDCAVNEDQHLCIETKNSNNLKNIIFHTQVTISIIVYLLKEIIKVLIVFDTFSNLRIKEAVIRSSIIAMTLAKLFSDLPVLPFPSPVTISEYVVILILDGIFENMQLLYINYYFTMLFNQTGIQLTDIISFIMNVSGIMIKIFHIVRLCIKQREKEKLRFKVNPLYETEIRCRNKE